MEKNDSIKYGKTTPKSINKIYKKPEILYLGELAVGSGACIPGSGDATCSPGVGAFACQSGSGAIPTSYCRPGTGPASYKQL
jgi:hypothetical protein